MYESCRGSTFLMIYIHIKTVFEIILYKAQVISLIGYIRFADVEKVTEQVFSSPNLLCKIVVKI